MASLQLLTTPLPFPTLPIEVAPKEQRPGVQRNWYVIVIVLHIVFFLIFMGLLIYYIWFVKTPGKWLTEEKIKEDGLSEWDTSSDDSDSDSDDSRSDSDDSSGDDSPRSASDESSDEDSSDANEASDNGQPR